MYGDIFEGVRVGLIGSGVLAAVLLALCIL